MRKEDMSTDDAIGHVIFAKTGAEDSATGMIEPEPVVTKPRDKQTVSNKNIQNPKWYANPIAPPNSSPPRRRALLLP